MKRIATIALCLALTGCATTARLDREGMAYESRPAEDTGLTIRTVAIEAAKVLITAAGAYFGARGL